MDVLSTVYSGIRNYTSSSSGYGGAPLHPALRLMLLLVACSIESNFTSTDTGEPSSGTDETGINEDSETGKIEIDSSDPCLDDNDGDGDNACSDCDDNDPTIFHGAIDVPCDGIDQDCDGVDADPTRYGEYDLDSTAEASFVAENNEQVFWGDGQLSAAGDIDLDGKSEVIIADYNYDNIGKIYFPDIGYGLVNLAAVEPFIMGENDGDQAGFSVGGEGDNNSDGIPDFVITVISESENSNGAYLFNGPISPTGTFSWDNNVAWFYGPTDYDKVDGAVKNNGDINGDGFDDLAMGSFWAADESDGEYSHVYISYGPVENRTYVVDAENGGDADALIIAQEYESALGWSIAMNGDTNGDGIDDLLLGAPNSNNFAGAVYLVPGPIEGIVNLSPDDVAMYGATVGEEAGYSVNIAADINGDGLSDAIAGAPHRNGRSGAIYIVYGSADLTHTYSTEILGPEDSYPEIGFSLTSADMNGDGLSDLVTGGWQGASWIPERTYLIYGNGSLYGSYDIEETADAAFMHEESIDSGFGLANAGDMNGDEIEDIIVGSVGYIGPEDGGDPGSVFLILGQGCL